MPKADRTSKRGSRDGLTTVVARRPLRLVGVAVTGFLGGVAEALFLVLVIRVIFAVTEGSDDATIVGDVEASVPLTLLLCAALVGFRFAMAALTSRQTAHLSNNTVAELRQRLVHAYLHTRWSLQHEERAGALQDYATTYTSKVAAYMGALAAMIQASVTLLALLSVAVVLDPVGAFAMVVAIFTLAGLLRPLRAAVGRRTKRATDAGREFAMELSGFSLMALEFRIFNVSDVAYERLDQRIEKNRRESIRYSFLSGMTSPIYSCLAYGVLIVVLGIVAVSDLADIAVLGAVMLVVLRSLSYGQALQSALSTLASNRPPSEDLFDVIIGFEEGREERGSETVAEIRAISVRDVEFAYEPERTVLSGLTFDIHRSEIIGIVGPSGSGKSTLVQLLLGLRDPQTGAIEADGTPITQFDRASWARKVTFVPQAPGLIPGSIRENIAFFRDNVTDEQVEQAARLAHLHDEIVRMPGGYDRSVGERGGHLSGGQQQRLTIARALVEQPDLMILDEPTSSLDVRSEHLLRTTLSELRSKMAVVVIAHRMSTLDICDRIMVLQDGRILGFDTPARLSETSEFYREALELSGLRPPS